MRLIATKPFVHGIQIDCGDTLELDGRIATDLLRKGLVKPIYETKVITAAPAAVVEEVKAPEPDPFQFLPSGFVPLRDAEPQELVAESNPVLPEPDVPEEGVVSTRRRRGRPRRNPK